jgi:Family of unknown function (DUF6876)
MLRKEDLDNFTGTSLYHKWSALFPRAVLTDGTKFLADTAGAYWLMDAIASHQDKALKSEPFQVWKLKVHRPGSFATLTCEDGNYNKLRTQEIEWTNFPLDEIELYAQWEDYFIIFLPSEY